MIDMPLLLSWQHNVPWPSMQQIEQNLIINRALVDLYNSSIVKDKLAFRGGTALNKLYFNPAARYSEDLDFVQCYKEPIGVTLNAIRDVLDPWLGAPKVKIKDRGVQLIYQYISVDNDRSRLKVEINTRENYRYYDYIEKPFVVESDWFSGKTIIKTYHLNELMGSKMRALYQRRKGRDLFDLWMAWQQLPISPDEVAKVFLYYIKNDGIKIPRALFESNMKTKFDNIEFARDVEPLIRPEIDWDFVAAYTDVVKHFVQILPD